MEQSGPGGLWHWLGDGGMCRVHYSYLRTSVVDFQRIGVIGKPYTLYLSKQENQYTVHIDTC